MGERIYGLLGRRLGHSYSVPLHQAFGCADYRLFEREPEELESFLRGEDIGGVNVTIPYKRAVMRYLDELAPEAAAIGSVNTVVRRGGRLVGYNTDAAGFLWMTDRAGIGLSGRKVVVLGSGGASLAVRYAAALRGAREIVTVSRDGADNYENLARHADADVLVNATPVGMYPDAGKTAADPAAFPALSGAADLVYNPLRTALAIRAEERGIPVTCGLPMLAAQARTAEELFRGETIPDEAVERALGALVREKTNIVLIGMPGSGKSSVGAALAALTGREVVDTDALTARAAEDSIPGIFAERGERGFRILERAAVAEAGLLTGKILVTGGGAVLSGENYAPLHQNGRIYEILRRTEALEREGRPLSESADLEAMYRLRRPFYDRFRDAAADNNGSVRECARSIWRDFCENTRH